MGSLRQARFPCPTTPLGGTRIHRRLLPIVLGFHFTSDFYTVNQKTGGFLAWFRRWVLAVGIGGYPLRHRGDATRYNPSWLHP